MPLLTQELTYVSAIARCQLDKIKQHVSVKLFKIDDTLIFQLPVENGESEKSIGTATLKFDLGDNTFNEHSVVMNNLTAPIIGLHFMRHNSVVIDTTNGLIHSPHWTMQVRNAASEASAKPLAVFFHDSLTVPPTTTKIIRALADHPSVWHTTCTVTQMGKFKEVASLLKSPSISTIIHKKLAVRVINTAESPF